MSEDKMREEFEKKLLQIDSDRWFDRLDNGEYADWVAHVAWQVWKAATEACAAIKDAEIAARDLMIKEFPEELGHYVNNPSAWTNFDQGVSDTIEQAIANSEHHNSRALEKMLLEARIDELKQYRPWQFYVSDKIKTLEAKFAELNKE